MVPYILNEKTSDVLLNIKVNICAGGSIGPKLCSHKIRFGAHTSV